MDRKLHFEVNELDNSRKMKAKLGLEMSNQYSDSIRVCHLNEFLSI